MNTTIQKYESTTQPGLFFFAERSEIRGRESWGVTCQANGFPPTEAHDDEFPNFKDADEIAQMLARGEPV